VITDDFYSDEYDEYETLFDPLNTDRQGRRKRKPRVKHIPKKARAEIIDEIAETTGLEGGFTTTYQPARFEEGWLLSSLQTFYDQGLIIDVMARVKGGKEANVYRCRAQRGTGETWLAAKVYRPRQFRNLRNDKLYRDGRAILKSDGTIAKKTDHRLLRALDKKSDFGMQVRHTSWLMHEVTTLERLYQAGAAVPRPFGAGENAILMNYIGDEHMAAPTLQEVSLAPAEAESLFRELLRNIELMLAHDMIHGDLSAYNVLYWAGNITLIDFPQVVNHHTNENAYAILQRDIERICEYFARQGVSSDPEAILAEWWSRYGMKIPEESFGGEDLADFHEY
jgi:RIO kinase 1